MQVPCQRVVVITNLVGKGGKGVAHEVCDRDPHETDVLPKQHAMCERTVTLTRGAFSAFKRICERRTDSHD